MKIPDRHIASPPGIQPGYKSTGGRDSCCKSFRLLMNCVPDTAAAHGVSQYIQAICIDIEFT
jgi:hypothetical protein